MKIPGVGFEEQYTRFYSEASAAAHLVGFVAGDGTGVKGYVGIEGFYERLLKGKERYSVELRDSLGRTIIFSRKSLNNGSDGRNFVLSLDRSVQFFVE